MLRAPIFAILIASALLFAACSGDAPGDSATSTPGTSPTAEATATPTVAATEPPATPTAEPTETAAPTATRTVEATASPAGTATTPGVFGPIGAQPILGGREFQRPVEALTDPSTGELWVVDQSGDIRSYAENGDEVRVVLDIRQQVSRSGIEEGLLSVALDPAFVDGGHLWVYYSVSPGARRTRLARFDVSGGVADPSSELVILEVQQPFPNHNGGSIRFGPDGMLYLGLGDGGSGGDPLGNGQNRETLLGTVIRLDVSDASAATPYRIPTDNPFVDESAARGEIWAYGLRNPWRMAFDPVSGALWLGDVGQSSAEEINVIERSGNYGWSRFEGFLCFGTTGCDRSGVEDPLYNYGHDFGTGRCSVTGGLVYRVNRVPEIANAYLFADFCSGDIWAMDADQRTDADLVGEEFGRISSFAYDADGEVLLLRFGASILRIVSP